MDSISAGTETAAAPGAVPDVGRARRAGGAGRGIAAAGAARPDAV